MARMFDYEYLSQEHLAGFEHYKYSSVDTNPLSIYVMHPFWNSIVKFFPEWVAPNVLTFTGFMLTVLNFLLFSVYDYEFRASSDTFPKNPPIPEWAWLASALCVFAAHTLDGIDGKQARRTKTSGPLGELFDHGLDSWTTLFIPACLYSVYGSSDYSIGPLRMYFCLWNVFGMFYVSHWEKYNTGLLFLPWGYDLSMVVATLIFSLTFFGGYSMWKFDLPGTSVSAGILCEMMLYAGSLGISLPMSFYNIYKAYKDGTGKGRSFTEANRPFFSLALFFTSCMVWIAYSPSNIIVVDPRAFYFMTGTVVSNICCRLIVNQMSDTRCDLVHWILVPVIVALGIVLCLPAGIASTEKYILWLLTGGVTLLHIHYGICVVRQMCKHFNIHCFSISKKED
ncbi:unnamed protein product [Darwinula stevensoni]|uniref:Ethanolaminephosphotransferase 1 n=1 Tax=Darwinula stevensoni TaxID=69355 RepID=A0A7R8XH57_9CRUS|nr:unnamed protein product [Darwinula stevensoni]CAG0890127.1 unnamed protein product [Darwinula stevensoni]